MQNDLPNNVTPVDILDALKVENASVEHLNKIIQLQRQIIETQSATKDAMRRTIDAQESIIQLLREHIRRIT